MSETLGIVIITTIPMLVLLLIILRKLKVRREAKIIEKRKKFKVIQGGKVV